MIILTIVITFIFGIILGMFIDKSLNKRIKPELKKQSQNQLKDNKVKKEESNQTIYINEKHTIKYCPIGDSLTAGFYAISEDKSFVNVLSQMLDSKMNFNVQTYVTAKPGGIISDVLNNIDKINEQKPDLITIEFGTNDSNIDKRIAPSTFANNLNQLIDSLTINVNRHPSIILVTTWNKGNSGKEFDNVIKDIGHKRNIPVADINSIALDTSAKGPKGIKTYKGIRDTFHPNDKGMDEIAKTIYDKAEPLLSERYNLTFNNSQ
jgi:lysophospholipase L1-like esterase